MDIVKNSQSEGVEKIILKLKNYWNALSENNKKVLGISYIFNKTE